jgi:SAM-dependent methyltransferase
MKRFIDYPGHITLESMSQAIWYNTWTAKKFAAFLNGDILEVGCGFGSFTPFLRTFGRVWAIDNDTTCLTKTRQITGKATRVGYGDIEHNRVFFKPEKRFDSIVCLNVLEHIKNDKQALIHMTKFLKPGGHLILLVPSHPLLFGSIDSSIGHYRRYSKQTIYSLLPSQLIIQYARRINFFGALGWFMSGKILKTSHVSSASLKLFNIFAPYILSIENMIEPAIGTSILIVAQKM